MGTRNWWTKFPLVKNNHHTYRLVKYDAVKNPNNSTILYTAHYHIWGLFRVKFLEFENLISSSKSAHPVFARKTKNSSLYHPLRCLFFCYFAVSLGLVFSFDISTHNFLAFCYYVQFLRITVILLRSKKISAWLDRKIIKQSKHLLV